MQNVISEILSTRNTIRSLCLKIVARNVAHKNILMHLRTVKFRMYCWYTAKQTLAGGDGMLFKCAPFWKETSECENGTGKERYKIVLPLFTRGDPYFWSSSRVRAFVYFRASISVMETTNSFPVYTVRALK